MKQVISSVFLLSLLFASCSTSQGLTNIQPKSGTIEIPAKGEFRMWKGIAHSSFTVTLTNSSVTQSCELYKVKNNGTEKWVSPSLLANTSLEVDIPVDGHLFIKNFNDNVFSITYKVQE
jgi:hypothetical protein